MSNLLFNLYNVCMYAMFGLFTVVCLSVAVFTCFLLLCMSCCFYWPILLVALLSYHCGAKVCSLGSPCSVIFCVVSNRHSLVLFDLYPVQLIRSRPVKSPLLVSQCERCGGEHTNVTGDKITCRLVLPLHNASGGKTENIKHGRLLFLAPQCFYKITVSLADLTIL